jgi:hypothetical protein
MRNKLFFLIGALIILSGCTGDEQDNGSVAQEGVINFEYSLSPASISQGDSAMLTMSISNNYPKPLENIAIRFEPTFSGITFMADGPTSINSGSIGTWIVDIQSAAGVVAKNYDFRPIICFDYSQDKRGYFRVAPQEPSTREVDYSTSDVGPLVISFSNLRGINAKEDSDSLDITVNYDYADTFVGLTNNTSKDNQVIKYGLFEIDSQNLMLRALQGSTRIKETTIGLDNYCRKLASGKSSCEFPSSSNNVYASSQFGFRINVSNTLESELETYFLNTVNYTICLKPISDFSLAVVKNQ